MYFIILHYCCVPPQGQTIDSEHLSEYTEEETMEVNFLQTRIKGFAKYDLKYFIPFFTRRFTQQVRKRVSLFSADTQSII